MSRPSESGHGGRAAKLVHWLELALARRAHLLADPSTNVARIFNAAGDGIDGFVIEKLGDVLVTQLHEGRLAISEAAARELCEEAARRLGARAVYRKVFPKDRSARDPVLEQLHRDPTPWTGTATLPELAVREHGLTFLVRPYDGYATGLFLDHRTQRARVRALAAGRRVLNMFSYTCGFTVAAAAGGAVATVNVDISKKYLEWGKRNLAANELTLNRHRFICADVFDYYRRAVRQGHRFDLIILDPPTFARVRTPARTFELARDLEQLANGAVNLLEYGGYVHLSANSQGISVRRLKEVLSHTTRSHRRRCEAVETLRPPDDFPGAAADVQAVLGRVL